MFDISASFNDDIIYTSKTNWLNDKKVILYKREENISERNIATSTVIDTGCTAYLFCITAGCSGTHAWAGKIYEYELVHD